MTQWTKEEQKALRGRGLSRWFGEAGKTITSVLHLLAFVVMLAAEIGLLVATAGCILSLLGVVMSWTGEQLVGALVVSVVTWLLSAFLYESTKA